VKAGVVEVSSISIMCPFFFALLLLVYKSRWRMSIASLLPLLLLPPFLLLLSSYSSSPSSISFLTLGYSSGVIPLVSIGLQSPTTSEPKWATKPVSGGDHKEGRRGGGERGERRRW